MAKPGTTHVIEIETGIGEPAFIPLTMGSELQPISVGKKGMWRIESPRVLDVHAFVYFDGSSLFLQSADESQAASVDGYRVGKAWTELHAPCKIEIGAARLRFRSLADAPEPAAPPSVPRPAAGQPPPPDVPAPMPAMGETNTRVGPVDSRPVGVVGFGNETRAEGQRSARPTGQLLSSGVAPVQAIPQSQHPPGLMNHAPMQMSGGHPMGGHPMNPTGPLPSGAMNMPPMAMGGMNGVAPLPSGSMSLGGPMGSGSYGSGGSYGGSYGGSMSGNRMAPTVQTGQGGGGELLAKYKELPQTKRLLVLMSPFCLIASAYLLLFDDEPPPEPAAVTQDAGPAQCQAGFVRYTVPINGMYPCVPLGTPMPPAPDAGPPVQPVQPVQPGPQPDPTGQPVPPPSSSSSSTPAPPVAANTKTLERQAVDAVAVNDYARAAAIYEQLLAQSNPKNPVYAEAARILHQKAEAGAPPTP